tara:strand:+ start:34 stop:630 length:597 start_codon:yes stop_codon:yes gene_type:complete
MPITFNGNGTVTGISVGGLPDGIVDTDTLANNAVTSAKSSGLGGLTMADQWRVNGDFGENNDQHITIWERNDNNFAQIGTGMTESSGIFTFPATGIYKVDFHVSSRRAANQNLNYVRYRLQLATDGGTNYNDVALSSGQMASAGDNQETFTCGNAIIDVTNATNFKLKLKIQAATHVRPMYSSSVNESYMTFLKLGET